MLKLFISITFFLSACILASPTSLAAGKTAYIMSCHPGTLGEVIIEPMVYDTAWEHKFDDVPQYNNRNFFYLTQSTKEKLSQSLIEGNVVKKDLRWRGATLIGYLEEFPGDTLPKDKRSLTETLPLNAKGQKGPRSKVNMVIEDNTMSCDFTSPNNIYTKIVVSFYQTKDTENICSSAGDERSLYVRWFTEENQGAVKTTDILMSCGPKSGTSYDVSEAKITTIGTVEVNLSRNKILHNPDNALYPRD